jgi:hypothetical protein
MKLHTEKLKPGGKKYGNLEKQNGIGKLQKREQFKETPSRCTL